MAGEVFECPACGVDIPEELNGYQVAYCPFCGVSIMEAAVSELGLEEAGDF